MKIAVIGGGIVGVSSAEWLRRDGHDVTLVDPLDPGEPGQTSYGNAGIIARAAVVPVSVPGLWKSVPKMLLDRDGALFMKWRYLPRLLPWLAPFLRAGRVDALEGITASLSEILLDAVDQHQVLAEGTPAQKYITQGEYAYIYANKAGFAKDALGFAIRKKHGLTWREAGAEELRAMDPNLSPDMSFAAILPDHAWITNPGRYVAALAQHFIASGGIHLKGKVDDIEPGGDTPAIRVNGETLPFDRVVLCAGVWSRKLAERLGHKVPMEAERGYHLFLRGATMRPPIPYMIADAKFVATPMEDGLRCAGLVEFGGTEAPPSQAPIDLLTRRIQQVFPGIEWDEAETWMGHRPSLVDSLPMIGESGRAKGIYFAFGAQHIGLTSGPKTGRIIADLIAGRRPNFDLAPFAPDRFDQNSV